MQHRKHFESKDNFLDVSVRENACFSSRQMAGGIRQDISMQAVNLSNMKLLVEWIKQSNLDPYDPENAFLINLMKVCTRILIILSNIYIV